MNLTYVKRVLQVKVVMTVEMTTDKLVNFGLACGMEILELMHSLEFDNI